MKISSLRMVSSAGLFAIAASCAIESGPEEGLYEDDDVAEITSPIRKGLPGAVNGATDYCNGTELCTSGEGDCDSSSQCELGLVCVANKGPQFGMPDNRDICLPAHCGNKRLDGNETQVDCGGSCGSTCSAHACTLLPVGHASKCVVDACVCGVGEGDCDSSAECAPGLSCVQNNGPKFGMPVGHDACAPAHCANKRLDGNETAVDCGGSCGNQGPCEPPSCTSLVSISFRWLATGCDSGALPISFSINGTTVASTTQSFSCTCTPGINALSVTDPAILELVRPGNNGFGVNAQHVWLAFSWATMTLTFANGSSQVVVLDDVGGGSTNPEQPDLCEAGYYFDHLSAVQTVAVSSSNCDPI